MLKWYINSPEVAEFTEFLIHLGKIGQFDLNK